MRRARIIDIQTNSRSAPSRYCGLTGRGVGPDHTEITPVASSRSWLSMYILRKRRRIRGGADLISSAGTMTMNVLNAAAQFEPGLADRTHPVRAQARQVLGRGPRSPFDPSQRQKQDVRDDLAAGTSVSAIARKFATSRTLLDRLMSATS